MSESESINPANADRLKPPYTQEQRNRVVSAAKEVIAAANNAPSSEQRTKAATEAAKQKALQIAKEDTRTKDRHDADLIIDQIDQGKLPPMPLQKERVESLVKGNGDTVSPKDSNRS